MTGAANACSSLQQFAAVCSGVQQFAAVCCTASPGGHPPPRIPSSQKKNSGARWRRFLGGPGGGR
eukprot:4728112-Alexandrium_andersonii.AAC.1